MGTADDLYGKGPQCPSPGKDAGGAQMLGRLAKAVADAGVQIIDQQKGDGRPNPEWRALTEQVGTAIKRIEEEYQRQQRDGAAGGSADKGKPPLPDPRDPFEGKGKADIDASGVDQSSVGDCFYMAALASLANSDKGRQKIMDMIRTNPDGSYTVTFPGDKDNPITVTQQDLEENQKNGQVEDSKLWARILETAFLKYDGAAQYGTWLNKIQKEKIGVFSKVATTDKALELLTGDDVATDALGFTNIDNREITLGNASPDSVRRALREAMTNGDPVTASAATGFTKYLGEHDSEPLVGEHVYSVLSYDEKTDTVVVRNPWGGNGGTPFEQTGASQDGVTSLGDGKLQMSLDTFMKYFNGVNIAGQNAFVNDLRNLGEDEINTLKSGGNAIVDLFTGNFSQAGQDTLDFIGGVGHTASSMLYTITDGGERVIKGTIGLIADAGSEIVQGVEDVVQDLEDVGSTVVNAVGGFLDDINPFG